jgi:predicted membrane channel-forming protein YqfA (hemolysin III family)
VTQNFPNAVGHALGFLIAVASVPVLAAGMLGQASVLVYVLPIIVILVLRTYLGTAVREALSPMRARAILARVDQAGVFVFIGSTCTVFSISAAPGSSIRASLGALAAVASFTLSAWLLRRARHTVSSSSFLSVLG